MEMENEVKEVNQVFFDVTSIHIEVDVLHITPFHISNEKCFMYGFMVWLHYIFCLAVQHQQNILSFVFS